MGTTRRSPHLSPPRATGVRSGGIGSYGNITSGRIMSCSSCSRMWQCHTYSLPPVRGLGGTANGHLGSLNLHNHPRYFVPGSCAPFPSSRGSSGREAQTDRQECRPLCTAPSPAPAYSPGGYASGGYRPSCCTRPKPRPGHCGRPRSGRIHVVAAIAVGVQHLVGADALDQPSIRIEVLIQGLVLVQDIRPVADRDPALPDATVCRPAEARCWN